MSGGHFNYQQFYIREIADEIEKIIEDSGAYYEFKIETVERFREAVVLLRKTYIFTHRIDWLLSGDDGEDTFHKRLTEDLRELNHD